MLFSVSRTPNTTDCALSATGRTTAMTIKGSCRWLGLLAVAILTSPAAAYSDDECVRCKQQLEGVEATQTFVFLPVSAAASGTPSHLVVCVCDRPQLCLFCTPSWVSVCCDRKLRGSAKTGRLFLRLFSLVFRTSFSSPLKTLPVVSMFSALYIAGRSHRGRRLSRGEQQGRVRL